MRFDTFPASASALLVTFVGAHVIVELVTPNGDHVTDDVSGSVSATYENNHDTIADLWDRLEAAGFVGEGAGVWRKVRPAAS
jgi:hypothetical protein